MSAPDTVMVLAASAGKAGHVADIADDGGSDQFQRPCWRLHFYEPRHGETPEGRHTVRKPSPAGRQAVQEPAHRDLTTLRPDSLPSRPGSER
jgi:hypothetical protein